MTKRGRPRHPDVLTPREWEVLSLIRDGLTNEQIADRIGVTIHAARYHVSQILSKLAVTTREEAAAWQPEPERAGRRWVRALQVALALAAVCVIVAVGVLAWGVLRGDDGDARAVTNPIKDNVVSMGLVSEKMGWVLTERALVRYPLASENDALDITPHGIDVRYTRGVHFLDEDHGWLALASQTSDRRLIVHRTLDGGRSWELSPIGREQEGRTSTRVDFVDFDFLDVDNGWAVLRGNYSTADPSELWRTRDGGATWEELTIPLPAPVRFLDENNGWVAQNQPNINSELYVTHDGGATWQDALAVNAEGRSVPRQDPGRFTLPIRRGGDGHLLMAYVHPEEGTQVSVLESADNGQTWHVRAQMHIDGFDPRIELLPSGGIVGIADDGTTALHLALGADKLTQVPVSLAPIGDHDFSFLRVTSADFFNISRGWAIIEQNDCLDAQIVFECQQLSHASYIVQTDDGGVTWTQVTFPEIPSPAPAP